MTRERARRIRLAHPATWPVVELTATVVAQLALTPLLLQRLGADEFAFWVIAQSLLLMSATLSLGTGVALLPALAGARSRHDAAGARAAIRLFCTRTASTSAALLGIAVLAFAFGLWPRAGVSLLLVASTLVWVSATEFDTGFSSALKALGRFDAVAGFEVASRAAQVALTIVLVANGAAAQTAVLVGAATVCAKAAAKYALVRRHWPPGTGGAASLGDVPRELRAVGAWAWLGVVNGLVFHAFDRWFVGAALGASQLAAYAVCGQIAQLPHAVASAAAQTLVPWAARRRDESASPAVRRAARRLMLTSTALAAVPSLLLLLLLEPLLALWISPAFAHEQLPLARGLVVVFLILSLNVPSYFLQFGFGHLPAQTLLGAVSAAVFIAGCLVLTPGIAGIVALKAVFAVLSLSLVVQFLRTSGSRR